MDRRTDHRGPAGPTERDWTGMHAVVVGAGSAAPDPVRANPSVAVVVDGEVLLFDCGERATVNLTRAGVNPVDVERLCFTHLHWDHIADLNYFLVTTWNWGRAGPLEIVGPPGTAEMVAHMVAAHEVDRRYISQKSGTEELLAPDYEVTGVAEGTVLSTDDYTVTATAVEHLDVLDAEAFGGSCWAYRVDSDYGSVAISGDTRPCEAMVELASDVDLLLHEAALLDETDEIPVPHSTPEGAAEVAARAGAGKLVLTHLGPYTSPPAALEMAGRDFDRDLGEAVWSRMLRDADSAFDGPVILADDAMTLAI